jgi:hypothetical protein
MIQTPHFGPSATRVAENMPRVSKPKVILIDGARLTELMFDYGVGVSTVNSYMVKCIDSDFFEDEGAAEAASETAAKVAGRPDSTNHEGHARRCAVPVEQVTDEVQWLPSLLIGVVPIPLLFEKKISQLIQ